jgi:glucose-1-phosphate cytidylyltransferase
MKVVILAGGKGTRLAEETDLVPKPMIAIGGRPILWHIMQRYSAFGIRDFIVCLGYKGYAIKEYFSNYLLHSSDVTIDLRSGSSLVHRRNAEPWKVTLIDTGEDSLTGGRLKRVKKYIGRGTFHMTYGDGVSDVDLRALTASHRKSGLQATVTAVRPPGRFGSLDLSRGRVARFREKPGGDGGWINGGFFVLEPSVLDLIDGDATTWELGPMERLAARNQLGAYVHNGFWHPMDTLRDKKHLEELWKNGQAPWLVRGRES